MRQNIGLFRRNTISTGDGYGRAALSRYGPCGILRVCRPSFPNGNQGENMMRLVLSCVTVCWLSSPIAYAQPVDEAAAPDKVQAESFAEDFRSATQNEVPEGWLSLPNKSGTLIGVSLLGRPHLRTFHPDPLGDGNKFSRQAVTSVRLPSSTFAGDFFMELSVSSNEPWRLSYKEQPGQRSFSILLKNRDESLKLRCFEDQSSFIATLPGSDESKPFSLSGKTPYKFRLERAAGSYCVLCNSKTVLMHAANDQREFDVCELELSPAVLIGSVKAGPFVKPANAKP